MLFGMVYPNHPPIILCFFSFRTNFYEIVNLDLIFDIPMITCCIGGEKPFSPDMPLKKIMVAPRNVDVFAF